MLVLSRRKGESVIIGDEVTITVVDVRGDQIRLGIDAPRSVKVYREEVYRQVLEENEAAARSAREAAAILGRVKPPPRTYVLHRPLDVAGDDRLEQLLAT